MKNKETGEFELVVGDKQLLSGFFIGIVLLAVVFALGYVLGRGTGKTVGAANDGAATSSGAPENRPAAASPAVPASPEPAAVTPPAKSAETEPATADTQAEAAPQPTTVPARDASAPAPKPAADPANASYWQVLAGSRTSADGVYQTLKGKGFPASMRPAPNNLTAVWVGPYTDKESLTKAKKALEEAGFNSIINKHQ